MSDTVNVIVYSGDNEYNNYSDILTKEKIKVVGVANDFSKIKAYLVLHKKAVVVIQDANVTENLDELLCYITERECGVLLCVKRFVQTASIKRYRNAEIIYRQQYTRYDEYIRACCNKAKSISEDLKNENKNIKANSIEKNEIKTENFILKYKMDKKEDTKLHVDNVETSDDNSSKNPYDQFLKNKNYKKIIAIGASTGGPETLAKVLRAMPKGLDIPMLIVQHMPENFTNMYANRISKECNILVVEPKNGDPVLGGVAYIAPGGKQMEVYGSRGEYFIKVLPSDHNYVNNPSVDVLFESVAKTFGGNIIAVMLTGMGRDGSRSMLKIKNNGGFTIGQDEKSSVVYGMPKAAYDIGAIDVQLSIDDIASKILSKI